jgi:chloride channel protein, CIC family
MLDQVRRRLPDHLLALWRQVLGHATGRWLLLGGCVGVLSGAAGFAFNLGVNLLSMLLLGGVIGHQPHLQGAQVPMLTASDERLWLVLPVLAVGGALSGWLAGRFAPDAAGGGINVAVEAFHRRRGIVRRRTTLTKVLASVLTLGAGGSAGREGPIALVGAGFGSWFARRIGLTIRDRRVLLVAGLAGGTAAVFHAPLAAAILAAEVLYRSAELESEALIPSFIAAIVGFTVCGLLEGAWNAAIGHPAPLTSALFAVPPGIGFGSGSWLQLAGYLAVAIGVVLAARIFLAVLPLVQRALERALPGRTLRAGTGALLTGVLAIALILLLRPLPGGSAAGWSLLGPGYGILDGVFAADQAQPLSWALVLAVVALGKILATACTVGSGCSGGLFAPSLVIGGSVGAAVGVALHGTVVGPPVAACALIGMAGFLAATHRTPVAALLMVSEIGGTYALLIPAMWVVGTAFLLMGGRTLVPAQVLAPGDSPAHQGEYFRDLFANATVAEAIDARAPVVHFAPATTIDACRDAVAETRQTVFPVLDGERLVGVVTLDDLRAVLYQRDADALMRVVDLMSGASASLRPDDTLARALRRFNQHRLDDLPVVDGTGRFLALLNREALFEHYQRQAERIADDSRAEGVAVPAAWRRTTLGATSTSVISPSEPPRPPDA